jgi:hypothetical protein
MLAQGACHGSNLGSPLWEPDDNPFSEVIFNAHVPPRVRACPRSHGSEEIQACTAATPMDSIASVPGGVDDHILRLEHHALSPSPLPLLFVRGSLPLAIGG